MDGTICISKEKTETQKCLLTQDKQLSGGPRVKPRSPFRAHVFFLSSPDRRNSLGEGWPTLGGRGRRTTCAVAGRGVGRRARTPTRQSRAVWSSTWVGCSPAPRAPSRCPGGPAVRIPGLVPPARGRQRSAPSLKAGLKAPGTLGARLGAARRSNDLGRAKRMAAGAPPRRDPPRQHLPRSSASRHGRG